MYIKVNMAIELYLWIKVLKVSLYNCPACLHCVTWAPNINGYGYVKSQTLLGCWLLAAVLGMIKKQRSEWRLEAREKKIWN